jgi:hypothetical protein
MEIQFTAAQLKKVGSVKSKDISDWPELKNHNKGLQEYGDSITHS